MTSIQSLTVDDVVAIVATTANVPKEQLENICTKFKGMLA